MEPYKNESGNAGIIGYEILEDAIIIQFEDRSMYLYNYDSCGEDAIETMKDLAEKGLGLTTFVNQHVREQYAEKME